MVRLSFYGAILNSSYTQKAPELGLSFYPLASMSYRIAPHCFQSANLYRLAT
ncbi:hypothetical protein SERLA73DRAFT_189183 [Serpula lacrymans var. lacrymans S7.3]|uniref:Uncharacterized protein n=1 Tax=Serpula lacrymans var. lacrymans (strain S7.3) TaxID=936435 RepID=F8QD15_SERL3|nr:hypothetical protein SERLA73DRAFT_189183 [Serpula lacrymans var. lacrymans S7.3]